MRNRSDLLTRVLLVALLAVRSFPEGSALAQPDGDPRREEAKGHFLRGVEHVKRGEWDAGVSEFLRSREILPTSTNTYNAAVALRKAGRFDESLEMYQALLREFPDIPATEKDVAERELAQLRQSIGGLELAGGVARAKVVVDGRERGTLPLAAPVAVSAGSHTIRVSADGYLPFEKRVDVVGGQNVRVDVVLPALTAAGRLSVAEQTGKALEVVVDDAAVGTTPWEGALAPGEHTVLLRGDKNVGTPPVRPTVSLDQVVTLNLLAEQLDGAIRIDAVPAASRVTVDGVVVGKGSWRGRLRPGKHAVEATAEGYLPFRRVVVLEKDRPETVLAKLERDPQFLAGPKPRLAVELDAALAVGAAFGGELSDGCTGGCSAGVPLGGHGVLHGIYQLGSGFGFGLDAGYLLAFRSLEGQASSLAPQGRPANVGTQDDALRLSGLTAGASALYRVGEAWPLTARLGAGVLLGSLRDERTGTFTNTTGEVYRVSVPESVAATYLYVAPELRVAKLVTKDLELSLGAEVLLMTALAQPSWRDRTPVLTSNGATGDGLARFGERTTAGSLLVFVSPGIGARYTF